MALILIVDDSPTEMHVMQQALERHGYRTAAAADGADLHDIDASEWRRRWEATAAPAL